MPFTAGTRIVLSLRDPLHSEKEMDKELKEEPELCTVL